MKSIETIGKRTGSIDVKISYRIIELFSAGLYSSPIKAFEELVCNSYDAFADKVSVYMPPDLTADGAYIWICDNGESMDSQGLKELWNIGESTKRDDATRNEERLQIGKFGIGKLATYVLANRLTYVCKKDGRYLATTMDYERISNEREELTLDEREIEEHEAEAVLKEYMSHPHAGQLPFSLFGKKASTSWTFSILTGLKAKVAEIKEGRLKWVLQTALPLNPGFELFYNGKQIQSSKITKPINRSWVLGKEDPTAESLDSISIREENGAFHLDFEKLPGVHGEIDLYEDSLVDGSKASKQGRSHGIFLMVRGRLVNLDDPQLGMEAFSHGAFNRTRIIVHADELDDNLTSTRESIKDSPPLRQLKEYLKKKFNNEVRKHHFDDESKREKEKSISYRMSQTSLTLSKRPLFVFAQKFFNSEIKNPILIEKPSEETKDTLLAELKKDLSGDEEIIRDVKWSIMSSGEPIAKFNLATGVININLLHPYIANFSEAYSQKLPVEFIAITEVLTEAHLYELGLDESIVNSVMIRRDNTLRELSSSSRDGAPAVAQMLKDSLADPTGLEDALHDAFRALGFETTPMGKKGKPDGIAEAVLGYGATGKKESYSLTYDAKSTSKEKVKASTVGFSTLKKHQTKYKADFSVVVAIDFEGADDPESGISKESKREKTTAIRARDLMRLLLLSGPKQIGLHKLHDLFQTCHTPAEVGQWVDEVQNSQTESKPIKELLDIIYEFQMKDTEAPEVSTVRLRLNDQLSKSFSSREVSSMIESLNNIVPGFVTIEDKRVGIRGRPEKVLDVFNAAVNDSVPTELQEMYLQAFSV